MKKLVLASLAGITAVAAATPVQAHPTYHYYGGCSYFTLSDGTDSSQTQWDGEVHAVAVATDAVTGAPAAVAITVECELRINGATPGMILFSASGGGVVAGASHVTFHADPDDIVTMCDNVTVGGEFHKQCDETTTTPIIPQPVQDAIELAEQELDRATCAVLQGMSGGPADQPPVIDIRSDGDVYVLGEWFWDCPPYRTSGT